MSNKTTCDFKCDQMSNKTTYDFKCEDGPISISFEKTTAVFQNIPKYLLDDHNFIDSMMRIQKNLFDTIDEYIVCKRARIECSDKYPRIIRRP